MLDSFFLSANAVLPIFVIIALGYFLRKKGLLSPTAIGEMNRLVFMIALPMLLFRNVYNADLQSLFDAGLVIWLSACIIICFVFLWVVSEICLRKKPDLIGAFVQASFRSNYAIIGIPLVANIMGENDTGLATLAAAFIVSINNVLAAIVLTAKDSQSGGFNLKLLKEILLGICKNYATIAILVGVLLNLGNVQLPIIVRECINYMAVLCTPMALIAIGGSIQVADFKQHARLAVISSSMKIVIMPLIFVAISIWLGFRGEELAVIFVMLAAPTAIISYVMAVSMNANAPMTSAVILITTVFSPITLTMGVYLLRVLELIVVV